MLFDLRATARTRPVLLSSPHSGRLYPRALLDALRVDRAALQPLDDGPVDVLLEPAITQSAGLLTPLLPRAWIDLNRAPDEMDAAEISGYFPAAAPLSPKVQAGLGLVPSRIGGLPLYRRKLRAAELEARLSTAYWPFHTALETELAALRALHGTAVLLDCHSMPRASVAHQAGRIDVVIGDRHGRAAAPSLTATVARTLREHGLATATNRPFAGGYITERHGRPDAGVHALQLEVRRDLFLDEADYRLHAGIGPLGQALKAVVANVAEAALRAVGRSVAA